MLLKISRPFSFLICFTLFIGMACDPLVTPVPLSKQPQQTEPSAPQPTEPPACTFPLVQITTEESTPEGYTFSEPKIVITEPDNIYDIVEWLPDNEQVLIIQDLNNIREKDELLQQSIELYNPETGSSKVYAIRFHIDEFPLWQPEWNAVVYPAMNFNGFEKNVNKLEFTRQVWVSYGNPDNAQMLADNLMQFPLAVKPDGTTMIYLSDKKIFKKNSILKDLPSVAFDSTQWDYIKGRRSDIPVSYRMIWQPGTSLIFLYGDGVRRFDGYTYILDTNTGQVCELVLGGWATKARWSSDGRYLAIIRTQDHFPISSSNLVVLDTVTGNVYVVDVIPQKAEGKHFINDIVWAPDNHHLLAIGSLLPFQSNENYSRLYLVDFMSGKSDEILPTYTFYATSSKGNLAWSSDGEKLLIRCPTMEQEQVCFISVQRTSR